MDKEDKGDVKYIYLSLIIAGVVAIVALLIDYRISIGILVGSVAYVCNYMIMTAQLDMMLYKRNFNRMGFGFSSIIRYMILFVPMLLAVLRPDRCNVFAVFGSMLVFKVIMYVQGIRKKVM